jgi:hypothetical protein
MHLLLNDKEIAHFLLSLIDYKPLLMSIENSWKRTTEYTMNCDPAMFNKDNNEKFKNKILKAINKDLSEYYTTVKEVLYVKKQKNYELIHSNIEYVINKIGKEKILKFYKKSKKQNFVKSVGFRLDSNPTLIRRKEFSNYSSDCLIRNTVGNEELLVSKLDNNYPFWFIDSGYTNFLETRKTYHRLVRNHLHFGTPFTAPVDRLGVFKKFPAQWRDGGEKILIVEPGPFAAACFHIDLSTWKYDVEKQLRQFTDKQIVFREKVDKKIRSNLYDEFCNEDYYCAISLNSNAATEAIWAGIPVITLGKHITNPVSRAHLTDINDLYRPNLASWLCMLSYSQFNYEELIDGTAVDIVRKYHV